MTYAPFGINFVVRLLSLTEDANSIVRPTPITWGTPVTLKTCQYSKGTPNHNGGTDLGLLKPAAVTGFTDPLSSIDVSF